MYALHEQSRLLFFGAYFISYCVCDACASEFRDFATMFGRSVGRSHQCGCRRRRILDKTWYRYVVRHRSEWTFIYFLLFVPLKPTTSKAYKCASFAMCIWNFFSYLDTKHAACRIPYNCTPQTHTITFFFLFHISLNFWIETEKKRT